MNVKSTSPIVLFRQTDLSFADPKFVLVAIYEDSVFIKENRTRDSYILKNQIGRMDTYLSTPDTVAFKMYCNSGEPITILFRDWSDATLLRKKIINVVLHQQKEDNYTHIPEYQRLKKYFKEKWGEWFNDEYVWKVEDSYSLAELINTINLKISSNKSVQGFLVDEFQYYVEQCRVHQLNGNMKVLNKGFTPYSLNKYFNSFTQIIKTKPNEQSKSKKPVRGKGTSYLKS